MRGGEVITDPDASFQACTKPYRVACTFHSQMFGMKSASICLLNIKARCVANHTVKQCKPLVSKQPVSPAAKWVCHGYEQFPLHSLTNLKHHFHQWRATLERKCLNKYTHMYLCGINTGPQHFSWRGAWSITHRKIMHNLAYQAVNRIKGLPLVCKRKTCMFGSQQRMKFEVKKS